MSICFPAFRNNIRTAILKIKKIEYNNFKTNIASQFFCINKSSHSYLYGLTKDRKIKRTISITIIALPIADINLLLLLADCISNIYIIFMPGFAIRHICFYLSNFKFNVSIVSSSNNFYIFHSLLLSNIERKKLGFGIRKDS